MKIECTLPYASTEINGVKFAPTDRGTVVSVDDVPEDAARRFLSIDGYLEAGGNGDNKQKSPPTDPVGMADSDADAGTDPLGAAATAPAAPGRGRAKK